MRITGYRGKVDPVSAADMWMRARPRDSGRVNDMEAWILVGLLSDDVPNTIVALAASLGEHFEVKLYEKSLCGGLMICRNNDDVAVAGIVSDPAKLFFGFKGLEGGRGTISIIPCALVYDVEDRALLFSYIQHELRHYMDYLDNDRRPIQPDYYVDKGGGDYEIDVAAYSRNLTEMRAHADQAIVLIKIMGGARNAKAAIERSVLGRTLVMKSVMMAFIDALEAEARSLGENFDPPAVVRQAEDHDVRKLVLHLGKMCELIKFSNNVRRR